MEVFRGSPRYRAYAGVDPVTTLFHLYELYYVMRRDLPASTVLPYFERLQPFCVPVEFRWLVEAAEFRLSTRRGLSYADCLGYVAAQSLGLRFLTGDTAFRDLENVEFVR